MLWLESQESNPQFAGNETARQESTPCPRRQDNGRRCLAHLALEMDMLRCLAPLESAVMKGRLMSVLVEADNSHFAFSAASLSRCTASLSFDRSIPYTIITIFKNCDQKRSCLATYSHSQRVECSAS